MRTHGHATISVPARDGSFEAYRVLPESTPAAAVIFISSIYGVTASMRTLADRYAQHGFIALVPDPFWRVHPGPLASEDRPAAQARGQAMTEDDVMHDIAQCIATLRAMPECNGSIALAGFCFGGKYAFLAAARGLADAAVAFHGSRIGTVLGEADGVRVPLSLHFGETDTIVTMDEVRAIEAALAGKPNVDITIYPGVGHGFSQTDNHGYDAATAAASEARALAVLAALR